MTFRINGVIPNRLFVKSGGNQKEISELRINGTLVWSATVTININSSTNHYRLDDHISGIPDIAAIAVNIKAGVTIGSTSTSTPAFYIGNALSGRKVTIQNNGTIRGRYGAAGKGGTSSFSTLAKKGGNGGGGGIGLRTTVPIFIENNGTIAGGGGGGGGGGGAYGRDYRSSGGDQFYSRSFANGGNGGANGGSGASGQYDTDSGSYGLSSWARGGKGGKGGSQGQAGGNGGSGTASPAYSVAAGGSGGAAGYYAYGYSKITWVKTGTRLGRKAG